MIPHELYYVTSNQGKFEEARRFFELHAPSISLKQLKVELDELQDLDEQKVLRHKAAQAWQLVQKPLLVDDSGFYLEAYPKFPGTLAKPVMKSLGFDGFKALVEKNNNVVIFVTLGFVTSPTSVVTFYGQTKGHVICQPEDEANFVKFGFYSIFVPNDAEKTYYELRSIPEAQGFFHRNRALEKFLAWYTTQTP